MVILGILRAVAPYAASFQGSRVGRLLTYSFFRNAKHRWLPVQRVRDLNLESDDCCELDEIAENADLAKLAKKVAKALGISQSIGVDSMAQQNMALAEEGFRQVGAGSGGYAVYECHRRVSKKATPDTHKITLLLHVTPYGPSLLNVMPRYIVLELEESQDRRAAWSNLLDSWKWSGPSLLEGFCYEGAFFSPHHFASMKMRYDEQLLTYDRACQALARAHSGQKPGPPTDQPSLKMFLVDGKLGRKRKKNQREYNQMQRKVAMLANRLKAMMSPTNCTAPKGVILYFEGLDCSGKSSTGGLIQQALEQAGFEVEMRQHNRPPTEEQKRRPWMERFECPDLTPFDESAAMVEEGDADFINGKNSLIGNKNIRSVPKCTAHRHKAMVWDRGPAGDFVYGALAFAPPEEKQARYREFLEFEEECRQKNILFIKLMFVTNRDSIAATLGKRLAQRKMTMDLKIWLKASRGEAASHPLALEGLDMIDLHIDPTDFVAFNLYLKNLHKFINFAINTDSDRNPWIVVNTTDRYNARKELLQVFEYQLDAFSGPRQGLCTRLCPRICCGRQQESADESPNLEISEMLDKEYGSRGLRFGTVVSMMGLLAIIFYYCEHTTFDMMGFLSTDGD
jgi:polyphosphate kinase 2 (PPK2 family)